MIKHHQTPHGFQHDEIRKEDYVLGGFSKLPFNILCPEADWGDLLPADELQSPLFETYSCTAHATINAIQMIQSKLFEQKDDYSERFTASISSTRIGGNSPHVVAEKIRKSGLVLERDYPTSDAVSWSEYYKEIPSNLLKKALSWLEIRSFGHEYVKTNPEAIYEALKSSPIGVSVAGWYEKDGMYIKPSGTRDNHWTLIVSAKKGKYWIVYDSYAPFLKKLPWDYDFEIAKRYHIEAVERKVSKEKKRGWFMRLLLKIFT